MNRRELLSVAAAAPFTPTLTGFTRPPDITADRLRSRIEECFECVEGPARAYFEGHYPSGEFGRAVYQSFANGMAVNPGDYNDGLESETLALESLWKTFEAYAIGKKGKLYWRSRPSIEHVTPEDAIKGRGLVEVASGLWQPQEAAEDGLLFPLPKTAAQWGYTDTKYYARMRLIITDLLPYVDQELIDGGVCKIERPSGDVWQRVGRVSL